VKYFVTGATGFVGGAVARQLTQAGHSVVALARTPEKAQDLVRLGVIVAPGDVTDRDSLRAPMTGVDGVFHIAGWYKIGVRDTSPGQAINVEGTRNVLTVMKELGIAKGVYTSTLAVNGDTHGVLIDESYRAPAGPWLSEYDRTKWAAHYEVAEPMMRDGLPLVIAMPGLVYGPGDSGPFRAALLQYLKRQLPLTPKRTAFSWGYVDDIARAHILAMERGKAGEEYIIAGPTHTFIDAMALAERVTGIKAPHIHPGPTTMRAMAAMMGVIGAVLPLPESYTAESLRVIAGVTYIADNAKAKRELGYDPRSLEAGLPQALAHEMRLLGMQSLPA
jgi:nucleoside-diphosphate-sugar epimerase